MVERLIKGAWVLDWMRQVRDGDRTAVLMWGKHREEYEQEDVWRERILKEMPPIAKYTTPQSLWLKYGKEEDGERTRGSDRGTIQALQSGAGGIEVLCK